MKLVKHDTDCIVWLKLEKSFFKTETDNYIAVTYIAPEGAPIHTIYDFDVFHKLEIEVSEYSRMGKVTLLGDMNSRTGIKPDFIVNDAPIDLQQDDEDVDTPLPRSSMDRRTNGFGEQLLDLCRARKLRIANGRLHGDANQGKYTCMTYNGTSVVDLVITDVENIVNITQFKVHDFNEFSNHAPVSCAIRTHSVIDQENCAPRTSYKWTDKHRDAFRVDLMNSIDSMNQSVYEATQIQDNSHRIESIVDIITNNVTRIAKPYFEKTFKQRNDHVFSGYERVKRDNAIWYNDECKRQREKVIECLKQFNGYKTTESRTEYLKSKKEYKYMCRKFKQRFNRERCKEMNHLSKRQPKEFWKLFKDKTKSNSHNVTSQEFYNHFMTLMSEIEVNENEEVEESVNEFDTNYDQFTSTFEELDETISEAEIMKSVRKLNSGKSPGADTVLNEYLKETMDILIKPVHTLFNEILSNGHYPTQWTKGVIVPIYKKGATDDPNNYRGISLVSCLGKLFSSILNERLKCWSVKNSKVSDAQFGFKANYSTVDAIFVLHSIIQSKIQEKGKLYCAFIDLKKAFDSVYRQGLWYKLIKEGIDGKMLRVIRSMYASVKSCVKHCSTLTDFFSCEVGLMQGEIISPFLFALFINDVELQMQTDGNYGITLEQLNLYILLFADDGVIFSETKEGLQKSLDLFYNYCTKWNLSINIEKTKIMVFRKGGRLKRDERWFIGESEVEIVNHFNYLGVVLSSGGAFIRATKTLSGKAMKALSSLFTITNGMEVPVNIMCNLFDSLVKSILNYGCEIWGFNTAESVERVHRKFCKWVLKVKQSTNSHSVYGELGRFPLFIERQIRCVKYWFRLLNEKSDNCILTTVYRNMLAVTEANADSRNWVLNIKNVLQMSGFPDVWLYPTSVNIPVFLPVLRNRLRDVYITEWKQGMSACTSLSLYREIKVDFSISEYLLKIYSPKLRKVLTQIRLSSHCLCIETGRHRSVPRHERLCTLCNERDVEDEYHFTIKCPIYSEIRKKYIKHFFVNRPSMFKFTLLLKSNNMNTLKNLSLYITEAFQLRKTLINIVDD